MKRDVVIISGARTPIGRFMGTLKDFTSNQLGALVIKEAVARAGIDGGLVQEVIMGSIIQTEPRGNPAREAVLEAGLPIEVTGFTVNKNCGSGLKAFNLAAREIADGDAEVMVAGGMESMSRAPFLLRTARFGYRMGHAPLDDFLMDVLEGMGLTAENVAERFNISREDQDLFAAQSQRKALEAIEAGRFGEEIVPVAVPQRRGDPVLFKQDEGPRPGTTSETLAKLRPAFKKDGVVTAGNSCTINDGAAALVLMSARKAEELGKEPFARVVSWASAGVEPEVMGIGPVPATRLALEKAGLGLDDIDVVELNEAFAAQSLAVIRELGMDLEKVNPNGGAIALGHPVGATGAVLMTKMIYELKRRGGRYGLVTLCIGGGQGIATIVENLA